MNKPMRRPQLMFLNGRPVWRLSSGVFITTEVADVVIKDRRVFGCGDGLFAGHPIHHSQTWRFCDEED